MKGKDMPGKFLVAVSAIIEREGKILVLQRSPFINHGAGEWEFVSGRVEPGESAEEAIKREIQEEKSLQVEVLFPFDTFYFLRGKEREEYIGGVNPNDQTAHQVKNVVYLKKSMPKEKTDERKSSQQRIEADDCTTVGKRRKASSSDLPRA